MDEDLQRGILVIEVLIENWYLWSSCMLFFREIVARKENYSTSVFLSCFDNNSFSRFVFYYIHHPCLLYLFWYMYIKSKLTFFEKKKKSFYSLSMHSLVTLQTRIDLNNMYNLNKEKNLLKFEFSDFFYRVLQIFVQQKLSRKIPGNLQLLFISSCCFWNPSYLHKYSSNKQWRR